MYKRQDIDRAVKYAVGMRYASIGLLEYYDAVGFQLESTIAGNVYPDLCDTKEPVSYTHLDVYKRQADALGYDLVWQKRRDT